jgi:hypothetical protein
MSDIVPAEPNLPPTVTQALAWRALGFTDVYSVRLRAREQYRELLPEGNDGECHVVIGCPPNPDWDAVTKQVEAKHKDVFKVRWFYRLGTVDDIYLRGHLQLIEE